MAVAVFLGWRQLGSRHSQIGKKEVRVVAKSVLAAGFAVYLSEPYPYSNDGTWVLGISHVDQNSHIRRRPIGLPFKYLHQVLVVGGIRLFSTSETGVAGRIHAWCPVQAIDA